MKDPMSNLAAFVFAREEELRQPVPNKAMIAICDIAIREAAMAAERTPTFVTKSLVED